MVWVRTTDYANSVLETQATPMANLELVRQRSITCLTMHLNQQRPQLVLGYTFSPSNVEALIILLRLTATEFEGFPSPINFIENFYAFTPDQLSAQHYYANSEGNTWFSVSVSPFSPALAFDRYVTEVAKYKRSGIVQIANNQNQVVGWCIKEEYYEGTQKTPWCHEEFVLQTEQMGHIVLNKLTLVQSPELLQLPTTLLCDLTLISVVKTYSDNPSNVPPLPINPILDIYSVTPEVLSGYVHVNQNWFFLCLRRLNPLAAADRQVLNGFWRKTSLTRIQQAGKTVGNRRDMKWYINNEETEWTLSEFSASCEAKNKKPQYCLCRLSMAVEGNQ